METAAAAAPEAPAISTVLVLVVVAATPKIRPKMETVPSSMPNTIVPAELMIERCNRCHVEPCVMMFAPSPRYGYAPTLSGHRPQIKATSRRPAPALAGAPVRVERKAHAQAR